MPPMPMDELLEEFCRLHFPRPPATPAQILAFEARAGWKLDDDLRAFYLRSNGGTLFKPQPNASYRLISLEEIERARTAIRGSDEDEDGSRFHFTLVDMQDTNYVVLDVAAREHGRYPLLDAFHETYPATKQIAHSFAEFLSRAMRSDGYAYWLE
jgi:cell wall assembly regulator SMI1